MTPSANGHYVSMVTHAAALRRTVRDPARSLTILGLRDSTIGGDDALMFMTTDARVRSSWVTLALERLVLWSTPPMRALDAHDKSCTHYLVELAELADHGN